MMKSGIVWFLEEVERQGEITLSVDVNDTADFAVNIWEGSLIQMKVS